MGKQVTRPIAGKGVTGSSASSPTRGKTCCLEIAKVKKMGFKVFAFKQRSEDGDSERVRYVYASDEETVRCRRELLQRLREKHAAIDLSVVLDDETVFGAELVNDVEVANAISSDDATSEGSIEPAEDYVMLVPPMPADDDCDLMLSLPDYLPDEDDILCGETLVEPETGEEDFFDSLRDWVWDGSDERVTQQCV